MVLGRPRTPSLAVSSRVDVVLDGLELGNGIGHSVMALSRGGYFPGVATAPFLLLFARWLAILQMRIGTALTSQWS